MESNKPKIAVMTIGGHISGKTAAMIQALQDFATVQIIDSSTPVLKVDAYSYWYDEQYRIREEAWKKFYPVPKQIAMPSKDSSRNTFKGYGQGGQPWKKKGKL